MASSPSTTLLQFLQNELAVSEESIASALQQSNQDTSLFPIVLWQHGLITLEQLDRAFDLLATTYRGDRIVSQ